MKLFGFYCVVQVMIGYYNRPEATAKVFDKDGFLHTGDVGYYNELEQVFVVDRVKELIKYKGFQVANTKIIVINIDCCNFVSDF